MYKGRIELLCAFFQVEFMQVDAEVDGGACTSVCMLLREDVPDRYHREYALPCAHYSNVAHRSNHCLGDTGVLGGTDASNPPLADGFVCS